MVYEVDDETKQLLEAVLNICSQASQLQIDPQAAEDLIGICDMVAERFDIEAHDLEVDDVDPANDDEAPPTVTVYRSTKPKTKKPVKFTVIDGDGNSKTVEPDGDASPKP